MTIRFRCKDFLLKECEFEISGAHSADEMMKLVDVHVTEAHRTVKVQYHGSVRIQGLDGEDMGTLRGKT